MRAYTEHEQPRREPSFAMRRLMSRADPPPWTPSQIGDVLEGVILTTPSVTGRTVVKLMDNDEGLHWEVSDPDLTDAMDRAGPGSRVRITYQPRYRLDLLWRGHLSADGPAGPVDIAV